MALPDGQNAHFSRGIRPTPPIVLAGGGGGAAKKMLGVRVFLALRQLPGLARGGSQWSVCVRKTCRRNAIDISLLWRFISERVATWQSTRHKVANPCHIMS